MSEKRPPHCPHCQAELPIEFLVDVCATARPYIEKRSADDAEIGATFLCLQCNDTFEIIFPDVNTFHVEKCAQGKVRSLSPIKPWTPSEN